MFCSQLQLLLVTLCTSVLLDRISAAPQRDVLEQILRDNANGQEDASEDVSEMLRLKLLEDLMAAERNEDNLFPERGPNGLRGQVARQLPNSQRERKAGCRNFYWKTFTSC